MRIKKLLGLLGLLVPSRLPTSTEELESIAEAISALYEDTNDDFKLVVRRRIAEMVLHTANKRVVVLKLRYYNEIRMALSAGAGFAVLEQVKKEEKAREQQRLKEANGQVVPQA